MEFNLTWIMLPLMMCGTLGLAVGGAVTVRGILDWWSGRRDGAAEHDEC